MLKKDNHAAEWSNRDLLPSGLAGSSEEGFQLQVQGNEMVEGRVSGSHSGSMSCTSVCVWDQGPGKLGPRPTGTQRKPWVGQESQLEQQEGGRGPSKGAVGLGVG